jgi:hypothetical protein
MIDYFVVTSVGIRSARYRLLFTLNITESSSLRFAPPSPALPFRSNLVKPQHPHQEIPSSSHSDRVRIVRRAARAISGIRGSRQEEEWEKRERGGR